MEMYEIFSKCFLHSNKSTYLMGVILLFKQVVSWRSKKHIVWIISLLKRIFLIIFFSTDIYNPDSDLKCKTKRMIHIGLSI